MHAESRHALSQDLPELARTLESAFFDDPVMSWFFEGEKKRRQALAALMPFLLRVGMSRGHVYTVQSRRAATIWSPPDVPFFDERSQGEMAELMRAQMGVGADEKLAALQKLEQVHPRDSHFYLLSIGTHADHQGRGLGAQVLEPVLSTCDAEQLPAYLESSNPLNIPFYERHGFGVVSEIPVPEGPTFYPMWREPSGLDAARPRTRR